MSPKVSRFMSSWFPSGALICDLGQHFGDLQNLFLDDFEREILSVKSSHWSSQITVIVGYQCAWRKPKDQNFDHFDGKKSLKYKNIFETKVFLIFCHPKCPDVWAPDFRQAHWYPTWGSILKLYRTSFGMTLSAKYSQ